MTRFRNPATYNGELLCICCGVEFGKGRTGWVWPICGDLRDDGTRYSHAETCAIYKFEMHRLCGRCELVPS